MIQQYNFIKGHSLGKRAPLRAWANIAAWQVRSRLMRGPLRCNWIGGSALMVSRGMTGATGNLYVGLHEFADMGFLLHLLRPGDLFVDVGANVGSYTVLAASVCGSDAIAFEPDIETAAHLTANLVANAVESRVDVRTTAVGAESGTVTFSKDLDTVNHIVDSEDGQRGTQQVPITTLDLALTGRDPLLMKIDVEGHEPAVIAGGQNTLSNPSLKAVILESFDLATSAILLAKGFRRYDYDPFGRALRPLTSEVCDGNSLFVRDEDFVRDRLKNATPVTALGQRF